MKIAVLALTVGGRRTALRVKTALGREGHDVEVYLHESALNEEDDVRGFRSLGDLVGGVFSDYDGLVFVMATGIVVRVIAPYVKEKREDPAVVVLDEKGQNVISLLSGHIGGANSLTRSIARQLEGNGVITTATDLLDQPAFDCLAREMGCEIVPFENLRLANSALVNEGSVRVLTDYDPDRLLDSLEGETRVRFSGDKVNFSFIGEMESGEVEGLISRTSEDEFPVIVSARRIKVRKPYLQLVPRTLVVGLGSKKGVSSKEVGEAVSKLIGELGLREESIDRFATVDVKNDEPGINDFVEGTGRALEIVDRDEIRESGVKYEESEFVKQRIGVGGVCEPAAILTANDGEVIATKRVVGKVTVAAVEESFTS